jgi:hypothetical protein
MFRKRFAVAGLASLTIFLGAASTALACDDETIRLSGYVVGLFCGDAGGGAVLECTSTGAIVHEVWCNEL